MSAMVRGTDRVLANGAKGAFFNTVNKEGKPARVFRIYEAAGPKGSPEAKQQTAAARAARANPRVITQKQAQQAFDKFYARTRTIKRGPRAGQPRFKSPAGRKRAMTYDLNHRGKKVVNDARYLHNPHAYDFQGVDTGVKPVKKASPKQLAALAKGRAALAARRRGQTGGYWW